MRLSQRIRLKCLECSGSTKEVNLCHLFDCPLWEWRFGCGYGTTRYVQRMKDAIKRYPEEMKELKDMGINTMFFLDKHILQRVSQKNLH